MLDTTQPSELPKISSGDSMQLKKQAMIAKMKAKQQAFLKKASSSKEEPQHVP